MLCVNNPLLESQHWRDQKFTANDPCLFVVYPPGASGDLLISIIDKHYLRTGCEYYGINEQGPVHLYTTDYKLTVLTKNSNDLFTEQWFFDFNDSLARRRLSYALLDQVIIGCHLYRRADQQQILDSFPQAKIINIVPESSQQRSMIKYQTMLKNQNVDQGRLIADGIFDPQILDHTRVLNVAYGSLWTAQRFEDTYTDIVSFLNLSGKLIRYDYIDYYVSMQSPVFRQAVSELNSQSSIK